MESLPSNFPSFSCSKHQLATAASTASRTSSIAGFTVTALPAARIAL
jgi:hypothetical protein